jgi:chromosome segregation ATPase
MIPVATMCLIALVGAQAPSGVPDGRKKKEPRRSTVSAAERSDREIAELRAIVDDLRGELRLFRDLRARASSEESVLVGMKLVLAQKQQSLLREDLDRAREPLRRAKEDQDDADYKIENIQPQLVASGGVNRERTERAVNTVLERRKANAAVAEQAAHDEIADIEDRLATVGRYIDYLEDKLSAEMEGKPVETRDEERGPAVLGNGTLRVYYSPGCRNPDRIPETDLVRFESVGDAEKAGYRLAADCP